MPRVEQVLSWLIEGRREDVNVEADEAFASVEAARHALEASLDDLRAMGATRARLVDRGRIVEVRDIHP